MESLHKYLSAPLFQPIRALLLCVCVALFVSCSSTGQADSTSSDLPPSLQEDSTLSQPSVPEASSAPASTPHYFIAFGDSGSGTSFQRAVADQMAQQHQRHPFDYALMLGDNIYHDGNIKALGETHFTKPYHYLLSKNVRFYPVLGNHDVLSHYGPDQIEFFNMPGSYYAFSRGPIDFFALNTNDFDAKQQAWLKSALAQSSAPWKIVYGHHPIYSSGQHGNSVALKQSLQPILEQYGVNLYLAGHDHNYERFAPINNVYYVISGGAGAYLRQFAKIQPGSQVRNSVYHFLTFVLDAQGLHMQAVDREGKVIDTLTIPPKASTHSADLSFLFIGEKPEPMAA